MNMTRGYSAIGLHQPAPTFRAGPFMRSYVTALLLVPDVCVHLCGLAHYVFGLASLSVHVRLAIIASGILAVLAMWTTAYLIATKPATIEQRAIRYVPMKKQDRVPSLAVRRRTFTQGGDW